MTAQTSSPPPFWKSAPLPGAAFLILTSMLMIGGGILGYQSGGAPKLDFIWAFDVDVYTAILDQYGPGGRGTFFWLTIIDMVFPFTVAWFALTLFRGAGLTWRFMSFPPVIFVILDLIENTSFLYMLNNWSNMPEILVGLTSAVTLVKLTSLAMTYLGMVASLVLLARRERASFQMILLCLLSCASLVLCTYLAPIQSTIWNVTEVPFMAAMAPWVDSALHTISSDLTPYYAFGRQTVLVYLGIVAGLFAARNIYVGSGQSLGEIRSFKILCVFVAVAMIGNMVEYWGGSIWGDDVKAIGFRVIETPALAICAIVTLWLGISLIRTYYKQGCKNANQTGWMFLLTLPAILLFTGTLKYLPHGPLLALSLLASLLALTAARVRATN